MKSAWEVSYPEDTIRYIDAFRKKFLDYPEVRRLLHAFFAEQSIPIRKVCELGSGTGSNLFELARLGYECLGVDSNEESIPIAEQRAKELGLKVRFLLMDFNEELPRETQDAILVLFVPIAIPDMRSLAIRAADILKPGGYFACSMLGVAPDYREQQLAHHEDMELAVLGQDTTIRFNFYVKKGGRIDWDAVYLIGNQQGARIARNRNTFDLLGEGQFVDLPREIYRHSRRIDLSSCQPGQCPPMTIEVLDVFQRI